MSPTPTPTPTPTALVAGASRGIGRAVVEALVGDGWRVVAGVRDVSAATFDHPAVTALAMDVGDPEAVRSAVAAAEQIAGGALAAVICNAGHAVVGPVEHLELDVVREMFDVNTFGAISVVQAALPKMRDAGAGHVILVSTVGVHLHTPFFGAYRASKAALNAMADTLAVEVRDFGVRISRVEPGMVDTEFALATRRPPNFADADNPYATMVTGFRGGLQKWRDWVNIPAAEVADAVLTLLHDPEPPPAVLVGADTHELVKLDEQGMRRFLGLDA